MNQEPGGPSLPRDSLFALTAPETLQENSTWSRSRICSLLPPTLAVASQKAPAITSQNEISSGDSFVPTALHTPFMRLVRAHFAEEEVIYPPSLGALMLLQVSLGPQFTLLLASPWNCQAPSLGGEGSHLGMAVGSGQHGDVIGRREGVPPLLDLPITLTLPPLGSAVLKPDLGAGWERLRG